MAPHSASWSSVVTTIHRPVSSRARGSRQRERDGRHVLPEDNLIRIAVEKIRHRRRPSNHRVVSPTGRKRPYVFAFAVKK